MTTFTDTWDDTFETKPDDDNYGYEIDNYMRKVEVAIRERMEVEHIWKIGATDGEHSPGKCKIVYVGTKSTFPTAKKGCEAIATDESNRPYVCLVDGTWTVRPVGYIGTNIEVASGVTIDGIDISEHASGDAATQHTDGVGDHTHESSGSEGGKLTSVFGDWDAGDKVKDTSYLAATDGFVCAMKPSLCVGISGYTDANNPPTTLRAIQQTADTEKLLTITMPVKKGNYWKVTVSSGTPTIYWLPIGG